MRRRLFGHEVDEARQHGWDRLSNGDLLVMAEEAEYDVLITTDQNMRRQQNMANRRVAIVVLMDTGWPRIARRTETVREALAGIGPGEVREVHIPARDEA